MAEKAGVQGGANLALETTLISLRHRGYKTQTSRTEYAARIGCSPKTLTTPPPPQTFKKPALPLSAARDSITADFQYI